MTDGPLRLEIIGMNGEWEGRRIAVMDDPIGVGREEGNVIIVDDGSVSGNHAEIQLLDREVWVQDLGSTNGTSINREEIGRAKLEPGDLVEFGTAAFRLVIAGAAPEPLPPLAPEEVPVPESVEAASVDHPPPPEPDPAPSIMPTGAAPAEVVPPTAFLLALLLLSAGFAVLLFYWIHQLLRT